MSAHNQPLPSPPAQLAPQTLPGLPGPAQLPLPPVGLPGSHLCAGTSSWTTPWTGACPAALVVGRAGGSCCLQLRSKDPSPRRDGLLAVLPGPPPVYTADGSSPLLRSKDPHSRATRTKPCGLSLEAAEGPEVHPSPLLWMPPPTRVPPAGERSGHKNLALEGLRDWYIRNSGLAAGPPRRPVLPHVGPQHPPFLHARCYEVGQPLYGAPQPGAAPALEEFHGTPLSPAGTGGAFTDG